jgi:uncharacterized protein
MLYEFWHNFTHNLFKPLLLFFYFGFLLPLLKVDFEFPYVIYQGLTMYLLLAIGWHGGEELAAIKASSIGDIAGFMVVGFVLNFVIGVLAYLLLSWLTRLRQVDKATVAGYYGSDSAGTFATCVAILVSVGMAFDAYMPVMLAVMEVPGCLVALFLVARLRDKGMDADGNMPGEHGYTAPAPVRLGPGAAAQPPPGQHLDAEDDRGIAQQLDFSLDKRQRRELDGVDEPGKKPPLLSRQLLREVFLNPGLLLLFGGITIGFISGLQGHTVTHDGDTFFIAAFQGALCLFLLEMGMTDCGTSNPPAAGSSSSAWWRRTSLQHSGSSLPTRTHTSSTVSSSQERTSCSRCSVARHRTLPSRRCSGWQSPRRVRLCL